MALIIDSWTEFAVAIAFPVDSAATFSVATFVSVVSVAVVSSSPSSAKMVYMLLFRLVYISTRPLGSPVELPTRPLLIENPA